MNTPHFHIKKGLDLPMVGAPNQSIESASSITHVALLGSDMPSVKPRLLVKVGDTVKLGEPIIEDKGRAGITYHAPAGGTVSAIHRGERRALLSVVIDVAENEAHHKTYEPLNDEAISQLARDEVAARMQAVGLWTVLRTRPFSKVPLPTDTADAIFVNVCETRPMAAAPSAVLAGQMSEFWAGIRALSALSDKLFICHHPGDIEVPSALASDARIQTATFAGKHPAGLSGTHIHFLHPVDMHRSVWTVDYQEVIAIGQFFATGHLNMRRVVALGGECVEAPALTEARVGARVRQLLVDQLHVNYSLPMRLISGSVLGGHEAASMETGFLGRYHYQVSVLPEGKMRELFGWIAPGVERFSALKVVIGSWRKRLLPFTTSRHGSYRAIVPISGYERVMPLRLLPMPLLKALLVQDVESAINLGCLELDEEDLSLATFACVGKYDYAPALRSVLEKVQKEFL